MKLLTALAAVVLGVAALWGAGELHYRSCVDAAEAKHPVRADVSLPEGARSREESLLDPPGAARKREVQERRRAIDGCSRLPW